MKFKANKKFISLLLAAVLSFALLFSACGNKVDSIDFKNDEIFMSLGEDIVIDSAYFSINPLSAKDKRFTLQSSDTSILEIYDNAISAIREGEVTLTIKSSVNPLATDTCTVYVNDIEPDTVSIIYDGELIQDADRLTNINFSLSFGYVYSPNKNVLWQVKSGDIVLSEYTMFSSETFSFMPQSHGNYIVSAQIDTDDKTLSDAVDVNVYKAYLSEPTFIHASGDLLQDDGQYKAVVFSTEYTDDEQNPERIIDWKVNGKTKSTGKTLSFLPHSAGIYSIELFIGNKLIGGATITAKGNVTPKNLWIDYDNCYPEIWLHWDKAADNMGYQVKVMDERGFVVHATDISTLHTGTAALFKANSVNLTSIIGASQAKNIFTNKFRIYVKALGDGITFGESDYSQPLATEQISSASQKYLDSKYYNGAKNYYLTNEEEFVDIFAYFFLWRDTPVLENGEEKKEFEVYINFDVPSAALLVKNAYSILHFTGETRVDYSYSGKIFKLIITFKTDALPSKATQSQRFDYLGGLGSVRPHVDYNKNNRRNTLPIDTKAHAIEVENTEQLYYITQLGYKPLPKADSAAESAYIYARNVLLQIITDSMTDIEKAHAIYDWIMWQVDYDHTVLGVTQIAESVKYKSYYLEGVFSDDYSFAVCDGIAKAYALMCNMENIPCVRVAGLAGNEPALGEKLDPEWIDKNWFGHAWNKVKINGEWYIVDATWGDENIYFKPKETHSNKNYEFGFHRYFLLTDKEIELIHIEDQPNNYPRTAMLPYNWYANEFEYAGETYSFYINASEEASSTQAEKLSKYMMTAKENGKKSTADKLFDPMFSKYNERDQYFPGSPLRQQAENNYIAFDIKFSSNLKNLYNAYNESNPLKKVFEKAGYKLNKDFYLYGDIKFGAYYLFIIIEI